MLLFFLLRCCDEAWDYIRQSERVVRNGKQSFPLHLLMFHVHNSLFFLRSTLSSSNFRPSRPGRSRVCCRRATTCWLCRPLLPRKWLWRGSLLLRLTLVIGCLWANKYRLLCIHTRLTLYLIQNCVLFLHVVHFPSFALRLITLGVG